MQDKILEKQAIILGALLHDVGKFWYRAEEKFTTHQEYSFYFVNENIKNLQCVREFGDKVSDIVGRHHNEIGSLEPLERIVKEADILSASERELEVSREARRLLLSIFPKINIEKGNLPEGVYYYKPGSIDIENIFPEHISEDPSKWQPEEKEMIELHKLSWEEFKKEIGLLPKNNFDSFFDTLYYLLQKWTSKVSSAGYKSTPDISLFDHLKTTSAIAHCIYEAEDKEKPFLLIEGDISGIQNFIYNVSSPQFAQENMAKRLRGRSFYISLLTDAFASFLLLKLGLYKTNLLLCGGGHFLILAPNNSNLKKVYSDAIIALNKWLVKEFKGNLYLISADYEVSKNEFIDFSNVLRILGEKLSEGKEKKIFKLLEEIDNFGPFRLDGNKYDVCPICQSDFLKGTDKECPTCKMHVKIGKILPKSKFILEIVSKNKKLNESLDLIPFDNLNENENKNPFYIYYSFCKDMQELKIKIDEISKSDILKITVYSLNNTNFLEGKIFDHLRNKNLSISFGFKFLGNYAPMNNDNILEFEELAKLSNGYPLLSILRMDVDSLGAVFSIGLGENKTISRVSTLSRELNNFFLGFINKIAEKNNVYIIYSGGDDLLVVGGWTNIIDFARDVKNSFTKFTCDNPNLTISGGIYLCKDNFPIGKSAKLAGEKEERAKNFGRRKDAICIFENVVHWDRFEELIEFAEKLLELVKKEAEKEIKIPRSFVHSLINYNRKLFNEDGEFDIKLLKKVISKIHYQLARRGVNSEALKEKKNKKVEILSLLLFDPKLLQDIVIPATYVLLKTREYKEVSKCQKGKTYKG